jgi:hypothetical protein
MYAPESWRLPVRLGLVAEFSYQKTRYEENSRRLELRPILDREFAHWQLVLNPVFERALHGPGTARGRNFEPALLVPWKRPSFSPSLEYYGAIESINVRPRAQPEVHQLFTGGDWEAVPKLTVNLGVGFDLGGRSPGVVLSRFAKIDMRAPVAQVDRAAGFEPVGREFESLRARQKSIGYDQLTFS